ncbi:hypothetical protein FS749_007604 [Ceratobasidium sp. UAMH 11750]|nr:hypothetical protein FS749_007604 [Ceratobasidium sp. UAMH 11750]
MLKLSSSKSELQLLLPKIVYVKLLTPEPDPGQPKAPKPEPKPKTKKGATRQTKKVAVKKQELNIEHQIDKSDLVLPPKFPCNIQTEAGLKQLELDPNIDFNHFRFHVCNTLGILARDLALAYLTCTMKWGERHLLTEEGEFGRMMEEVKGFYDNQISTIRAQQLKDVAAAHNATLKGRVYVPKVSKHIPGPKLTIYNKSTTSEKVPGVKSKAKDESKPESMTAQLARAHDKIQRKICKDCGKPCVLVPQADRQPQHKVLQPQHIDLWAEQVAQGLCTISQPPPALVLSLADATRTRNRKEEKQITFFSLNGADFHISPGTADRLLMFAHKDALWLDPTDTTNSASSRPSSSRLG